MLFFGILESGFGSSTYLMSEDCLQRIISSNYRIASKGLIVPIIGLPPKDYKFQLGSYRIASKGLIVPIYCLPHICSAFLFSYILTYKYCTYCSYIYLWCTEYQGSEVSKMETFQLWKFPETYGNFPTPILEVLESFHFHEKVSIKYIYRR